MSHSLVAAVTALTLAAGSAEAARFVPYDTAFTWTGKMHFQAIGGKKLFGCAYTFHGVTGGEADGGAATITSATFCPKVTAIQLPWAVQAVSHKAGNAYVTMSISVKGSPCGPAPVGFQLRDGTLRWGAGTLPNGCFLGGGDGTSTPRIGVH